MNQIKTLLNRPKKWEDNFLYPLILNNEQAFEAQVLSIEKLPKLTKIKLHLLNIKRVVYAIFFKFSKYHNFIFKVGNRVFIRGKIDEHNQIIHPKILKEVNKIVPIYSNPKIKSELKKIDINKITLLPKNILNTLYYMHFPRNLEDINENKISYALKFSEIFIYIYKLQFKKTSHKAPNIKSDYKDFIKNLPFKLTNDQLKTIKEIQKDLSTPIQAKRVIIGDVGSGKTIVMLATAFMAKKSVIMAPTSILANQIYEEAIKYLKNFKITLITQKSKFTQEDINNSDLLIGTHALLYQKLPPINAVIIDEQHRFGTNQRAMLEKLSSSNNLKPHSFQFSATPIPRTQALIMSNFVNVSLIKEIPFKKDIKTLIISKEDFKDLMKHIKKEIANNNQVIIVYPLVEESKKLNYQSIEESKDFWLKHFKNVYITHGKDKNKENILIEFREKGDILITTTVIEVGISLPRLTTIVIVGAERLGLATLHQLRGRVSRYGQKGYCYLYTHNKNNKRLQQFAKITDGFKIAELDLKFRKSGDLVDGKEQSGETFKYFDESTDYKILEDAKKYLSTFYPQ